MDLIVQKAVEIGADQIAPIISDRTVVQVDSESAVQKQAKWQQIAIEAAKQCGQNWLPHVHVPRRLAEFFDTATPNPGFDLLPDRVASARCATLEKNPRRLFERTSAASAKRFDACRTGRRFHACGTCASPPPWVSAHHSWPNYPASGNGRDLLSECSFLRVTDVTACSGGCVKHEPARRSPWRTPLYNSESSRPSQVRREIPAEQPELARSRRAARAGLKES